MATRAVYEPHAAEFPATNYPQLIAVNLRPALAFDATTEETAYFSDVAPQGLTGTLTLVTYWVMASATSGNLGVHVAVEAVTPGDSVDLDAGTSFDTVNTSNATAVAATAGYLFTVSITLTNADSVAAGDYLRISIYRDTGVASNATGDAYLLAAELRDAA